MPTRDDIRNVAIIAHVDHDEHRWLGADDLLDVPWIPVDLPLVEQLRARLHAPAVPEPPGAGPARR